MAIAFDAATDGGNNGGSSTSLTFSHTCSGSERGLLIGFVGDVFGGADDIASVTYGGVGATLLAKYTGANINRFIYIYWLTNPASGASNVVITASSTHYLLGGAASYTGVAQSGQPDNTTTNQAGSGALSLTTSLTTAADNSWATLVEGTYSANSPPAAGTNTTRRTFDAVFGGWGLFDRNAATTPAGSVSLQTTRSVSPSSHITHVMASIGPAVAAATGRINALVGFGGGLIGPSRGLVG